ncbi:hypothetical protein VRB37_16860 [Erwinia billingiae]|uniref:hypothetical protein n=1 Tax=Erwinia billingiae TaxID=182337 RepID=UPI0030D09DFA
MKHSLIRKNIDHQLSINSLIGSEDGVFNSDELLVNSRENQEATHFGLNESDKKLDLVAVIEKSSNDIVYSLQHPPKAPLLSATLITALISTLCAATAAFFYNRLHWYFVNKRERRTKIVEALVEIVGELRVDSVSYWLKGYSRKASKDLLNEEMRIKSSLQIMNSSIDDYIERVPVWGRGKIEVSMKSYHDELYDVITGDDFESQGRKVDKAKAAQISNKCAAFKVYMNSLKA